MVSPLDGEAARLVAHDMVLSTQRAGHQAQRVVAGARPLVDGDPIPPLLDWLTEHLHERIEVADMARRVAMSERTFARRFKEVTASTPMRWLTMQRGARALQLLEATSASIDEIAVLTGFSSTSKLRDQVRIDTGLSPTAYRRMMSERQRGAVSRQRDDRWPAPVYGGAVPSTGFDPRRGSAAFRSERDRPGHLAERPAS